MKMASDTLSVLSVCFFFKTTVPIRIYYLDRSNGSAGAITTHEFTPDGCFPGVYYVSMLYRPGHYDILDS